VNNADVSMRMQDFLLHDDFDLFGYVPRSDIAGSYSIIIFSLFEELPY
jgi:hypothetical protein